jgi:hypothetical protein
MPRRAPGQEALAMASGAVASNRWQEWRRRDRHQGTSAQRRRGGRGRLVERDGRAARCQARCLVVGERLAELLRDPGRRRMAGDADVCQHAPGVADDEEDAEHLERGGEDREEVDRGDDLAVVGESGAPPLPFGGVAGSSCGGLQAGGRARGSRSWGRPGWRRSRAESGRPQERARASTHEDGGRAGGQPGSSAGDPGIPHRNATR